MHASRDSTIKEVARAAPFSLDREVVVARSGTFFTYLGGNIMRKNNLTEPSTTTSRSSERGAALATSLIVLSLLACISMTVLAVVTHEVRIAGSDLQRTQTFYAAAAGMEKMTADFSSLFARTSQPTQAQLDTIAASYPTELINEGFTFSKPDGSPGQLLSPDPGPNGSVTIP